MRRAVLVCLLFASRLAFAHQTSVKYVDLTVDGATAHITLRVAPGDVTEPMHLPSDARPTVDDAARTPEVAPFVAAWLQLRSFGEPCTPTPPVARAEDRFVAVTWSVACSRAPDTADFTRFFAVDRKHVALVQIPSRDPIYVRADDPIVSFREPPTLFTFVRGGIHHIVDWDGRDHICFVLALLLVVMLARDGGAGWRVRTFVPTLRSTATVITAFTIAHSISLIAAALGYVTLPSRVVESLIALSIAYTAAENIVKPDVRWRFFLTFGFGLVHGLGFASTLAVQLPPRDVIVPLLCFNIGVELGQLIIVAAALPVFYVLARLLGGDRYRRYVMPVISGAIFLAGIVWVFERTLLT